MLRIQCILCCLSASFHGIGKKALCFQHKRKYALWYKIWNRKTKEITCIKYTGLTFLEEALWSAHFARYLTLELSEMASLGPNSLLHIVLCHTVVMLPTSPTLNNILITLHSMLFKPPNCSQSLKDFQSSYSTRTTTITITIARTRLRTHRWYVDVG